MTKSEKSKKRRTLSPEKIIDQAVDFAVREGVEALSMRKLAELLGATAMSIYNHIEGKEDLLDRMLNRIVAEIETPDLDGDWQDMMRRRAHSMRQVLLRHRWAMSVLISKITFGDAVMRDINATVGCLVTSGFSYAEADWARNAIDSHVYGYTIQELNIPVRPDDFRAAAAQYLPMITKSEYPYIHSATQQIISGQYDGKTDFSFGLELILAGLKKWQSAA